MAQQESGAEPSGWTRRLFGESRASNMYVFGFVVAGSIIRLFGDHSNAKVLWANVLLLVVGVVGFTLAAFRLRKEPKVPQLRFTDTGDLE